MRRRGFTLIELMIVVAIIAIIVAIAVPNLLRARLSSNETSAIASLRSIATAQAQFGTSAKVDVDRDGMGEFGMLRELSGGAGLRVDDDGSTLGPALSPAVLTGAFRTLNAEAECSRSGYLFKIFLPDDSGAAVEESVGGGALSGAVSQSLGETTWCAYAWPSGYSQSGVRTFFINQAGEVTAADAGIYDGPGSVDVANAGAAFRASGPLTSITGVVAVGTTGRDAETWRPVQ